MLTGALISLVLLVGIFLFAKYRAAPPLDTPFGNRRISFTSSAATPEAFKRLTDLPAGPLQVAHADPASGRLLLEDQPSLASWGFYYPVTIVAVPEGGSRVDVGIKSRAFQFGPLVTRAHEKLVADLKSRLG